MSIRARFSLGIAAAICVAGAAIADEVWSTGIGDVVYERDLDTGEAVLSYPTIYSEVRGLVFIEGLAGQFEGRSSYSGIWVEPGAEEQACAYAISHPETGDPVFSWGRISMIFVEPDFPGGWVISRGTCFDDPDQYLIGKPIVGGE